MRYEGVVEHEVVMVHQVDLDEDDHEDVIEDEDEDDTLVDDLVDDEDDHIHIVQHLIRLQVLRITVMDM